MTEKYGWLLNGYDDADRRPSCAERLRIRRQLTAIIPGYGARISQFWVKRTYAYDEYTYKIDDFELTMDETLDILMGRRTAPTIFDPRIIDTAPAPRVFPTAIDHSEIVPTVAVALPLELEAA